MDNDDKPSKEKQRAPKKKKEPRPDKPASLAEAGLENFTMREVSRKDVKGADYNPRMIRDDEKAKLKLALKRHGLVAPITWNKRTGNIVGGHQRMAIMDSLMGTGDYALTVAEIDVPLAREKELNILLNNQQAQGAWDMAGLKTMFEDTEVTLEGAGFSMTDMIQLFGDTTFDERPEDLAELASRLSELTSQYTSIQRANKNKATGEFYLVVVFPTSAHIDALLAQYKLPDNRYQNGRTFMRLLNVPEPEEEGEGAAGD